MSFSERSYWLLAKADLAQLKELAYKEHGEFIKRNSHLEEFFYKSLIGICLCQGAASHYLNPAIGIKDFRYLAFLSGKQGYEFPI